jgi:hypothetical protein
MLKLALLAAIRRVGGLVDHAAIRTAMADLITPNDTDDQMAAFLKLIEQNGSARLAHVLTPHTS